MNEHVTIVLVGIGGYGNLYVDELLKSNRSGITVAGAVDPYPEGCSRIADLRAAHIPIFPSLEKFYQKGTADLAVISSPIQFHDHQACLASSCGSNVLCEKPLSSTAEAGEKMLAVSEKVGKQLAIGYQWSYSQAIQKLKQDIIKGALGKPRRLKTIALWPRDLKYFARPWAGKKADINGNLVLDSVANNATAHFLHNMFYVLGPEVTSSARPAFLRAEVYRANDVETFDTIAVRTMTTNGVELMFFATHSVNKCLEPRFVYEFEDAVVEYECGQNQQGDIVATLANGQIINYGNPFQDVSRKLWMTIEAITSQTPVLCPAGAALSQTMVISGIHRSVKEAPFFPTDLIQYDRQTQTKWVLGLSEVFLDCYHNWKLPSEAGASWAQVGKDIFL